MPPRLSPAWRDYRTRLCALVGAIVALVLAAGGGFATIGELTGGDATGNVLASAGITAIVAATVWYAAFPCPYCGKCFHWTLWIANPISRVCLHCGFEKWRDPHAARALVPHARPPRE